MVGLKVSFPATAQFFPEHLSSLLSRPGQILEAKVETISGRLITLLIGQERLEALLTPDVPPKNLHPGQMVRLKIVRTGSPVVLSLVTPLGNEKEQETKELIQVLLKAFFSRKPTPSKPLSPKFQFEKIKLETLLGQTLALMEDQDLETETSPTKALRPHDASHSNLRLPGLLSHLWESGLFFLPFFFPDRVSWGLLEEENSQSQKGTRVFRLRLFLSKLGALEIVFLLRGEQLEVQILAARGEVLPQVQKALPSLYQGLKACYPQLKLNYGLLEPKVGSLLTRAG